MATYGLLQFLFAPFWGSLSDRFGRKPILMIGVLGNALAQLFFAFPPPSGCFSLPAPSRESYPLLHCPLPWRMSAIALKRGPRQRNGIIGAAMGIGMVLGPGLGGVLAARSLSTPFLFCLRAVFHGSSVDLYRNFRSRTATKKKREPPSSSGCSWADCGRHYADRLGCCL